MLGRFQLSQIQKEHLEFRQFVSSQSEVVVEFEGEIDIHNFAIAIEQVLTAHSIFSTQLVSAAEIGVRVQEIVKPKKQHDHSEQKNEQQIVYQAHFDNGTSVWAKLSSASTTQHVLVISFPSFQIDNYSVGVLLKQLGQVYFGQPLKEDLVQFVEVSEWLNEVAEEDDARQGLSFWSEIVSMMSSNARLSIELKTEDECQSRTSVNEVLNHSVVHKLSLTELCCASDKLDVAKDQLLFATWQLLLSRLSYGEPVCIGLVTSLRTDEELSEVIGPLSRPVPYLPVNNLMSLVDVFQQNNGHCERTAEWLEYLCLPHQQVDYVPYTFEFIEEQQKPFSKLAYRVVSQSTETLPFNLNLLVREDGGELHLVFRACSKVYSSTQLVRVAEQYIELLHQVVLQPKVAVKDIQFLPQGQIDELVTGFNQTQSYYDAGQAIFQYFEQTCAKISSTNIAVESESGQQTYYELNVKVAALADELCRAGVNKGDVVALHSPRHYLCVSAILAIWRVGAVYLPIELELPEERIKYILIDSNAKAILTTSQVPRKSVFNHLPRIEIDNQRIEEKSLELKSINIDPEADAYLIYTSGSTGKPKGVVVSHDSFVSHCFSIIKTFNLQSNDKVLVFPSLGFDPYLEYMLPPLLTGACIFMREDKVWDAAQLAKIIAQRGLTVTYFPTPYWQVVTSEWSRTKPALDQTKLRLVCAGGDEVKLPVLQRWYDLGWDKITLINEYGPTEGTITATTAKLSKYGTYLNQGLVTIGVPLPNRKLYILDENLQHVPLGCVGEIYLAGEGLAKGYLNQDDLTQSCFLEDPFSLKTAKGRMYKTGDLGFFDELGQVYFCGRVDSQIKIRGYRVETTEIEKLLISLDGIDEAIVLSTHQVIEQEDKTQARLVAMVSSATIGEDQKSRTDIITALREKVATTLPEYMQLYHIELVSQLPKLVNAKLDVKRIKLDLAEAMSFQHSLLSKNLIPPRTDTERTIAKIWKKMFNLEQVSLDDNFFELGGHSLSVMSFIGLLRNVSGIELSLKNVFDSKDLRSLASQVDDLLAVNGEAVSASYRVDREQDRFVLTPTQERFWFLHEMGFGEQYHMPAVLMHQDNSEQIAVNLEVLQISINLMVQRHESLRLVFEHNAEGLSQSINADTKVFLEQFDATQLHSSPRVSEFINEWLKRPFDLRQGPLFRVLYLNHIYEERHTTTVLLCCHHIIADGISSAIFRRELTEIYFDLLAQKSSRYEEPLDWQFLDYAHNLGLEKQGDSDAVLGFWRQYLEDYQDLDLVIDPPRPKKISGASSYLHHTFSAEFRHQLEGVCKQFQCTPYQVFLSAVYVCLSKFSGQEDMCIGSTIANRDKLEFANVIGPLINNLPVRMQFDNWNTPVSSLFHYAKSQFSSSFEHQSVSYDQIVEALNCPRNLSKNPIFQVLVNYNTQQVLPEEEYALLNAFEIELSRAKFDLMFDLVPDDNEVIHLYLEYSKDIFQRESVAEICESLIHIVTQMVKSPSLLVSDLSVSAHPIQLQAEHLFEQSGPASLAGMWEKACQQGAERLALTDGQHQLSFAQLQLEVDRYAYFFQKNGVLTGQRVALLMPRSVKTIVTILALIKLGVSFVPLALNYPRERIKFILNDANVTLLLTFGYEFNEMVPNLDVSQAALCDEPQDNALNICNRLDVEAYVIYTSGSTGKPKGVPILQQDIAMYALGALSEFHSEIKMSVVSNAFTFDGVGTTLWQILNGKTLMVIPESDMELPELASVMKQSGAGNLYKLTPSHLNLLLYLMNNEPTVQKMIVAVGGEPFSPQLLTQAKKLMPNALFVNHYGPTEATIGCLYNPIDFEITPNHSVSVPVGKPMPGRIIRVVDRFGHVLPKNAKGELWVGGQGSLGISRGYIGHAEALNKERFIPRCGNEVFYRTGDQVSISMSNQVVFHSRMDSQLNINGYRIEATEIHAIIQGSGLAYDSVVTARDIDGIATLVAYVVWKNNNEQSQELRKVLRQFLPSFMCPEHILSIKFVPLNHNGKVDYSQLPIDFDTHVGDECAPQQLNSVAAQVAPIWLSLLKQDTLEPNRSFFSLGGNSLALVKMHLRLSKLFNVKIELGELYDAATFSQIIKLVASKQANQCNDNLVINVAPDADSYPMSFAQESIWLQNQMSSNSAKAFTSPAIFAIDSFKVPTEKIKHALTQVEAHHEILRTTYDFVNGVGVQKVHQSSLLNIEEVDLSNIDCNEHKSAVDKYYEREAKYSFDLKTGPIWKVTLLKLCDAKSILLFNIHHICTDGLSTQRLVDDWLKILNGEALTFPTVTYKDYAVSIRAHISKEKNQAKLAQIKARFADVVDLPYRAVLSGSRARSQSRSFKGGIVRASLSEHFKEKYLSFANKHEVTPFSLGLAITRAWLFCRSNRSDIVIGTDVAGRDALELDGVLGCFVNQVPLRNRLKLGLDLIETVRRESEAVRDAMRYQDLPFEYLLSVMKISRSIEHAPLFQIKFAFSDQAPDKQLIHKGIKLLPATQMSTRHDLMVNFVISESSLDVELVLDQETYDQSNMAEHVKDLADFIRIWLGNPTLMLSEIKRHFVTSDRVSQGSNIQTSRSGFDVDSQLEHLIQGKSAEELEQILAQMDEE